MGKANQYFFQKKHKFYKIRHFFYYKYYVSVVATALMSVACGSVADAAR